jgi:hypothetical protein
MIAYGPWIEGAAPLEKALASEPAIGISALEACARAARARESAGEAAPVSFYPGSIIIGAAGEALELPEGVRDALRALESGKEAGSLELLRNPALRGWEGYRWGILVAAYKASCGDYPYESKGDSNAYAERISCGAYRLPSYFAECDTALDEAYQKLFAAKPIVPSNDDVARVLGLWKSAAKREAPLPRELKAYSLRTARLRRRVFFKRHGLKIGIGAAALTLLAIAAASIMGNALRPSRTKGLKPIEVAKAWYGAINTLEPDLMRDARSGKAGESAIGAVENVMLIAKIRTAYEYREVSVSVEAWDERGRTELPEHLIIYGCSGLTIEELPQLEEGVFRYEARYELVSNVGGRREPEDKPEIIITPKRELLEIAEVGKDDWRIIEIKPIEEAPAQ